MSDLLEITSKLSNYKSPLFKSYEGANSACINKLEEKLLYSIPKDFREFLLITNGAIILHEDVYGINEENEAFDLYENYLVEKNEVGNPIRDCYLPIYPDGMGNHNCLDLKALSEDGKICNVIFWQHDRFYESDEQPDIDADSFTQFLGNLLKRIEKEYNFDGTEK